MNYFATSRLMILTVVASLIAAPASGGQFRRSFGRGESLKARSPAIPAVRIGRATLSIDVRDATQGRPAPPGFSTTDPAGGNYTGTPVQTQPVVTLPPVTQVQAALDQVFRESFTIVQSSGDALLRVAIVHYTPAESVIDRVEQKVRVPSLDPVTNQETNTERTVVVEQWKARGQIAVRAEVVDSSGVLIDGFAPQASVQGGEVISVDGQDRVDRTLIPSSEQVVVKLITDLVSQFKPRYCPPANDLDLPLAVDDELRAGNKLAREGDLAGAARAWELASMARNPGDRIHNLGTLYEAQAYDLLMKQAGLDKARAYLERAARHYAEAAALDPDEKFIARAAERVRKSAALVAALEDLEQRRQTTLTAAARPSPWPPGSVDTGAIPWQTPGAGQGNPATDGPFPANASNPENGAGAGPPVGDPFGGQGGAAATASSIDAATQEALRIALEDSRPDTAQEAVFRQFVTLRMQSLATPPDEAATRQIESTGTLAYGLSALSSKRVVHQETKAWVAAQPKISTYRESFAAFATDGRITMDERSALQILARNLALSDSEIRSIESAWKVAE